MKRLFIILVSVILLIVNDLQAQKTFMVDGIYSTDPISSSSFNDELFEQVLLYRINSYMDSLGMEGFVSHEFFKKPAQEHAAMMAEAEEASLEGRGMYATVSDRLIEAGGTGVGAELVSKQSMKSPTGDTISYANLADMVLARWITGKNARTLLSQRYFFAGVSAKSDAAAAAKNGTAPKRIYIAMYVGNYHSFMPSDEAAAELSVPITTKKYGLKHYDEKVCKKLVRRMPNIVDLQAGLSMDDNGTVTFEFDNLKQFKRIIRDSKDGLAVDIVQKSQFDNNDPTQNIADYSNVNVGYMTKRIWTKKLLKNNIAEPIVVGKKSKIKSIKVNLAELPDLFKPDDVELNLMVIKSKIVCSNIMQSWVDGKVLDMVPKTMLLPDTVENTTEKYVPIAASTQLKPFIIPFEQAKYEYKPEDMQKVIATLDEPSFIINKILIKAYSSLEGSVSINEKLQIKRAQSIVRALEENQNASIVDTIVTAPNFEKFKADLKGTPYEAACDMDYDQAVAYANAHAKALEPYLKNHRYAEIVVWITYDASGDKERDYVIDQFNDAVAAKKLDQALKIQKYILKRTVEGVSNYKNPKTYQTMRIPDEKPTVGIAMNKIWLQQFIHDDNLDEESGYMELVDHLYNMDNANIYVEYNDILCKMMQTSKMKKNNYVENLQKRIDNLYNSTIYVDLIDGLNLELQYQVMDIYKDSIGYDHPMVVKSLEKIKQIIKFDKMTWQSALKLSGFFILHHDYQFALSLLEPWIMDENAPFELLSTYATLCTKVDYKVHSNRFFYAMQRIKDMDPNYFCNLFNGDKISVQAFVNTKLKALYCETCKK